MWAYTAGTNIRWINSVGQINKENDLMVFKIPHFESYTIEEYFRSWMLQMILD